MGLDGVEFIMALEDTFNITFEDENFYEYYGLG
jgi:acyl carrier protein